MATIKMATAAAKSHVAVYYTLSSACR